MENLRFLFIGVLVFVLISYKLNQPFWGHHEFNGVFYGTIAKNYLRYGWVGTRGAQVTNSTPTSQDHWSLHAHHPATYPLLLSFLYRIFGSAESVARFFSIVASVLGVVISLRLIDTVFANPLSWLGGLSLLFTPLFLYYGSMPVFEPLLFPVIAFGLYRFWHERKTGRIGWVIAASVLAILIDWPGFWLPVWLIAFELLTQRRKRVVGLLAASIILSAGLILAHQTLVTGSPFSDLFQVGAFRLGFSDQPYTPIGWIRTLISRTRAFFGLPILLASGIGFILGLREKKLSALFLLVSLGMGVSHIVVFRNITWYHDYMLYHLLPFLFLSLGSLFHYTHQKTDSQPWLIILFAVITVSTVLSTKPFFQALTNLRPHKDCVEMGYEVRERKQKQTFFLNREKAKECPPFIGYYGERPFEMIVED